MSRPVRIAFIGLCIVQIVFALGFSFQVSFFVNLWPLPYSGQMNPIFVGSFLFAAASSVAWCLWMRADGALAGIGLDYSVTFIALTIYALQLYAERPTPLLLGFVIASIAGLLFGLGLFAWALRQPLPPTPQLPLLLRISFMVFVIVLLLAGIQLVLRTPGILPWQTTQISASLYGWMFIGSASYFTYGLLRPGWSNAGGQLAGFLGYDLVLILPVLLLFRNITPALLPNLIIYLAVLIYSGALAIYYLFLNRETRLFPRHPKTTT